MNKDYARYILEKTREDYDRIAEEFSNTRSGTWEDLNYLKKFVADGDKVLDLGCGNGRIIELFKDRKISYTGVDNSKKLIEIARKRYEDYTSENLSRQFVVGDALNLPFGDNTFDKIYSVAVFHHIPSKGFRLEFLKEAKRVLKKNGLLVIVVWNLWQRKTNWKIFIKMTFLKLIGLSKLDFKDSWIPWQNKINRYIHSFTKHELKNVVSEAGFSIEEVGLLTRKAGHFNIYIIGRK